MAANDIAKGRYCQSLSTL